MLVTITANVPVGVTVTRNGVKTGVGSGHPMGGLACAGGSAAAAIDTDDPPANGAAFVGAAGPDELHDERSHAVPSSDGSAMSLDMGNLRPPQSKPSASTDIIRAIPSPEEGCLPCTFD